MGFYYQPKKTVIVSGAGGLTGQILFRKLLALPDEFQAFGLVRNEASKQKLHESGIPEANIFIADITNADAVKTAVASIMEKRVVVDDDNHNDGLDAAVSTHWYTL